MVAAPSGFSDGHRAGRSDPSHQCPNPELTQTVAHVEEFFSYRPPTLVAAADHTDSEKTRSPAEFDRHLDPSLRLRRVVYLPSIVDDLKQLAEDTLRSAADAQTLPPISDIFPDPAVRHHHFATFRVRKIRREKDIQNIYNETTARFCAVVAATLEFNLPHWSNGHLEWTLDSTKSRGVADGLCRLEETAVDEEIAALSDELMTVVKDFPVLGIWEFKSLKAGSIKFFEAIVRQSAAEGEFRWEGCKKGVRCPITHKGDNNGLYVTGSKMAFDASGEADTCKSTSTETRVTPGPPTSQISESCKLHARHMTQQTWTEAVNEDATFVVINAGNIEIIGKRERATQTLYISDVIDVTACDYGKLHTGLYIAAIRDARNRTARLRRCEVPPASWTISHCTKKPNSAAKNEMRSLLVDILACDWLAVIKGSSYKHPPFPFYHDSYWIRTPPFAPIEETRKNMKCFIRLSVIKYLGSDTFRGRVEMGGTPFKGIKGEFAETVVVKYGGTGISTERLEHEYHVLQRLEMAGVNEIPKVIGLFYYQAIEENTLPQSMAALVMEDAGEPVDTSTLSNRHIGAFEKVLDSIHQSGFLHGNIQRHNLVIRNNLKLEDTERVAIVGFGDALSKPSEKENADELMKLMSLLPNPLKHVESGNHTPSFIDIYPDSEAVKHLANSSLEQSPSYIPRKRTKRA